MRDRVLVYQSLKSFLEVWPKFFSNPDPNQLAGDHSGSPGVLATLTQVSGSYFRQEGVRALFLKSPTHPLSPSLGSRPQSYTRVAGVISGGCLEKDLIDWAEEVADQRVAKEFERDLSQPSDIYLGYGSGCPGKVRILLEALAPFKPVLKGLGGVTDFFKSISTDLMAALYAGFLPYGAEETVYGDFSSQKIRRVGRLEIKRSETFAGVRLVETEDRTLFYLGPKAPNPTHQVIWEPLRRQPHLVIFGAGDDGAAVVELFLTQGFAVTVVDHRLAWIERSQQLYGPRWNSNGDLSGAKQVRWQHWGSSQNFQDFKIKKSDTVILMTHLLLKDVEILKNLAQSPDTLPFYIGILGARKRAEMIQEALKEALTFAPENSLERLWSHVRAPMGRATYKTDDPWLVGLTTAHEVMEELHKLNFFNGDQTG